MKCCLGEALLLPTALCLARADVPPDAAEDPEEPNEDLLTPDADLGRSAAAPASHQF